MSSGLRPGSQFDDLYSFGVQPTAFLNTTVRMYFLLPKDGFAKYPGQIYENSTRQGQKTVFPVKNQ